MEEKDHQLALEIEKYPIVNTKEDGKQSRFYFPFSFIWAWIPRKIVFSCTHSSLRSNIKVINVRSMIQFILF